MNNSTCVYFCLLSVMNVVIVLEHNQNNILTYRNRFQQLPQGLLNVFEGHEDRFWNGLHKQYNYLNIISQLNFHESPVSFNLRIS